MRHFKILDNDLVANSRFGVEVMKSPRPIVLKLSKDFISSEVEVDLELECAKGNISGAEMEYIQLSSQIVDYHFAIVENTFVALTEVGQEIMSNPRPVVVQLSKDLTWEEVNVDLVKEVVNGNICDIEKQYLEFAHGL